jgi:hypothetical protein
MRTLTVSVASSTAENITITLDGDADATVAVTASANITTTCNEIAAHDYSDVGRGWNAEAVGDTVVFTSWDAAARTGTYSLTVATTAVGAFAQTVVGAAQTDTWVNQANWNGDDIFDGNGITGQTLDPTKGNVFQVVFQYLGFGAIAFFVEDSPDGEFHLVHVIEYANNNIVPSMDNPTLPMCMAAENTSNTSDIVLKSGSLAAFVQGKRVNEGVNRGVEGSVVVAGVSEVPIMSFRLNGHYQGKINRAKVKVNLIAAAVDHSKPVTIKFYANAILTDAVFTDVDPATSTIQEDHAATLAAGGTFLFSIPLGRTGSEILDFLPDAYVGEFNPTDMITATALPNSGNNAEANVSFNFTEKL